MIKTEHIDNRRKVGSNYFKLLYDRNLNKKLEEHLSQFNFDDYLCYKGTGKFRQIETIEELKEFKYSHYTLFKMELYSKIIIDEWIDFIYKLKINPNFLHKPFPPEYVKKLIKVI